PAARQHPLIPPTRGRSGDPTAGAQGVWRPLAAVVNADDREIGSLDATSHVAGQNHRLSAQRGIETGRLGDRSGGEKREGDEGGYSAGKAFDPKTIGARNSHAVDAYK